MSKKTQFLNLNTSLKVKTKEFRVYILNIYFFCYTNC
jgi:hypothetical protein